MEPTVKAAGLFPLATFVLSLGAAVVYAWQHDWRHALYWAAAAIITVVVTV